MAAIERLPLGMASALEFLGPLGVALGLAISMPVAGLVAWLPHSRWDRP